MLPVVPTYNTQLETSLETFSGFSNGLTKFSCSDMECTMKFLASLERSGELIAVKCLQRREKASVSLILSLSLFVCLPRSIHFTPFLLPSPIAFPLFPRAAHSSVIRSNTALLARPTRIADRDLAHLQLLCFVSIPFITNFARNSGTD